MYSAADLHALSRVLAAFVLANATLSRETGAVRKLLVSSSARVLPPMSRVRHQTIPTARYGLPKAIPA